MTSVVDELNWYFDSPAEPNNVHMEVWLPGHLDIERLRDAVIATLAEEPAARVRQAAGEGFAWEIPSSADLDPVSGASWRREAELDNLRIRFLRAAPPLDRSPQFRLLVARGPGWDSLILNAHHAAFDGHSCLRLLRLIADQYNGCEPRQPQALAHDAPAPAPSPFRLRTEAVLRVLFRPTVRMAPRHSMRGSPRKLRTREPGYGFRLLPWPDVPAPPPHAPDDPHTTVNDLLIAALIQTIIRWNASRGGRRSAPIRITMPVNARRPGQRDDLGNLSRLCTISADPSTDLLKTVTAQTARAKLRPGPPVAPALAALARLNLPPTAKRRLLRLAVRFLGRVGCDTSLLSNLGNVTDPPQFGALAPVRMWFSTTAHMPRGLSVGAISVAGRLQLCFRYRYALLDDEAAREFAAEYAVALSHLARTSAGTDARTDDSVSPAAGRR